MRSWFVRYGGRWTIGTEGMNKRASGRNFFEFRLSDDDGSMNVCFDREFWSHFPDGPAILYGNIP